jgi:hypothetical protein
MKIFRKHGGYKKELSSEEAREFFDNYDREVEVLEGIVDKLEDMLIDGVVVGFDLSYDSTEGVLTVGPGILITQKEATFFSTHNYSIDVKSGNYVVMNADGIVYVSRGKENITLGYYDGTNFSYDCRNKYLDIERTSTDNENTLKVQFVASKNDLTDDTKIGFVSSENKFYVNTGEWEPIDRSNVIGGI